MGFVSKCAYSITVVSPGVKSWVQFMKHKTFLFCSSQCNVLSMGEDSVKVLYLQTKILEGLFFWAKVEQLKCFFFDVKGHVTRFILRVHP